MKFVCVIPARYASTRFPGKPLALIDGHPMIEWVYRRATVVKRFDDVLIATDDRRIYDAVGKFGGKVIMTPEDLASGSDRVARVAESVNGDVYVNLQGDEPLINPRVLENLCLAFDDPSVLIATPVRKIRTEKELTDPNYARVIIDNKGDALYFTRAVVPFFRGVKDPADWLKGGTYFKHIGIYAYRRDFLIQLAAMPQGKLEQIEKLEQLRVLENGYRIRTVVTDYESISVDTPDELNEVNNYVQRNGIKMDVDHEKV